MTISFEGTKAFVANGNPWFAISQKCWNSSILHRIWFPTENFFKIIFTFNNFWRNPPINGCRCASAGTDNFCISCTREKFGTIVFVFWLIPFWYFLRPKLGINFLRGYKCAFFCTFLLSTVIFFGAFALLGCSYCMATKLIHIVSGTIVVTFSKSFFFNFHEMSSWSLEWEYDFTKTYLSVKRRITFFFLNKSKDFITEHLL